MASRNETFIMKIKNKVVIPVSEINKRDWMSAREGIHEQGANSGLFGRGIRSSATRLR